MLKDVIIGKVYLNLTNNELYRVVSIGLHTELVEPTVHYVPLYDAPYKNYYRPYQLFCEKFVEAVEDDKNNR